MPLWGSTCAHLKTTERSREENTENFKTLVMMF